MVLSGFSEFCAGGSGKWERIACVNKERQKQANGRPQVHSPASSGMTCRVSISTSFLLSSPFLSFPVLQLAPRDATSLSLGLRPRWSRVAASASYSSQVSNQSMTSLTFSGFCVGGSGKRERIGFYNKERQKYVNGRPRMHSLASSGRTCRVSLSTSVLLSSPFLSSLVLELAPPKATSLSLRPGSCSSRVVASASHFSRRSNQSMV